MTGPRILRPLRAPITAFALLAGSVAVQAQPGSQSELPGMLNRPEAARRIVRLFDFNHREKFALPQFWRLAQDGFPAAGSAREGFPTFNGAEHDTEAPGSGGGAVRVWTKGGSTSLRLDAGVVPVFPETEYLVSARIQTRRLTHARAVVVARYLDRANRPVPDSESRTDLVATEPGEWRGVSIALSGACADAAYIQIDLEILQPEQFRAAELGAHQVWPQDYSGDAWFDDVVVTQVPRVSMTTASPCNLLLGAARPTVNISIRDLAGEPLTGRAVLQDASGRVVDTETRPLDGGLAAWSWTPRTDRFGWYRVALDLSTKSRRVGGTYIDFAWLPARPPGVNVAISDRARFGLIVPDLPSSVRDIVPQIVAASGTGSITIPVWPRDLTAETAAEQARQLAPLVNALRMQGQRISFGLRRVPTALAGAAHLERDEPLDAFAAPESAWAPYVLPLIDKYGQSVQRWQIGAAGSLGATRAGAIGSIQAARSYLAKLVPGPIIEVPWPADLGASGSMETPGIAPVLFLPYATPHSGIADLLGAWRSRSISGATLVSESLPESQFSRQDAAIALVKRAVEFWRAAAPQEGAAGRPLDLTLSLVQPWSWPSSAHGSAMPTAELAALASVTDFLDGRRVLGTLPASQGVTCYILAPVAPGRSGALVAWTDGPTTADAAIDAYLGPGDLRLLDLWGNASGLKPVSAAGRAPQIEGLDGGSAPLATRPALTHHIRVGPEPLFVEGVDVDLARFVASFHLDPASVESTGVEHEVTMVLSNPFKARADGRITILEPGGLSADGTTRDRTWKLAPRVSTFAIAPGEMIRIPVTVSFSAMEEAGPKPFIAEVDLTAGHDYAPIRLRSDLDIRLDSLELNLSYRLGPTPTGPDVLVEAQVTNHSKTISTIEITAFAPGHPRGKASVADLAPGESATRRFAFPGGAAALRGERIAVGAQDVETQGRINRSIQIE